jgi:hypothetical protein
MSVSFATSFYDLKAGNPGELVRHRQTDDLNELWEWLNRYKEREGVTDIVITSLEPTGVQKVEVAPGIAIAKIEFGAPTIMLALQRKDEASPWNELTPGR